jgi:hypothetical protein
MDEITINKKVWNDYPDWVKKCPQCQKNDIEFVVELNSDNRQVKLPLCEPCIRRMVEVLTGEP